MLNFLTCKFWVVSVAKMRCILVHHGLNYDFSTKLIQIVFVKYDSRIKDNIRALTVN
jgi:hypothetical protein